MNWVGLARLSLWRKDKHAALLLQKKRRERKQSIIQLLFLMAHRGPTKQELIDFTYRATAWSPIQPNQTLSIDCLSSFIPFNHHSNQFKECLFGFILFELGLVCLFAGGAHNPLLFAKRCSPPQTKPTGFTHSILKLISLIWMGSLTHLSSIEWNFISFILRKGPQTPSANSFPSFFSFSKRRNERKWSVADWRAALAHLRLFIPNFQSLISLSFHQ